MSDSVIAAWPPSDGREWDVQCARCGSNCTDLDMQCEPMEDEEGRAIYMCISDPEWCEANPLEGREAVERGELEWFTFDPPPAGKEPT